MYEILRYCIDKAVALKKQPMITQQKYISDMPVYKASEFWDDHRRMAFMLKKVRFARHIDFLCYAPAEFERLQQTSAVIQEALQHGEVMYSSGNLANPDGPVFIQK